MTIEMIEKILFLFQKAPENASASTPVITVEMVSPEDPITPGWAKWVRHVRTLDGHHGWSYHRTRRDALSGSSKL